MQLRAFVVALCLAAAVLSDKPEDLPCVTWEPYTADTWITHPHSLFKAVDTYVIGSMDCGSCFTPGTVFPCFASDPGTNTWGHHDYNWDWVPSDYCRVYYPGGVYLSYKQYLPKKGPQSNTWVWQAASIGDSIPANSIAYNGRVLARASSNPPGCCSGKGFTGWASMENGVLSAVYFADLLSNVTVQNFEVAVCKAWNPPPTPVPATPSPPVTPIPTPPPTPVPPPTPIPTTPAPDNNWNIIERTKCLIGCDYNCTTFMYINGACYDEIRGSSTFYSCSGGQLTMNEYSGPGCTGAATTVTQPTSQCYQKGLSDQYVTNICKTVAPPTPDLTVRQTTCVEGCDYECTEKQFPSSQCSDASGIPTEYTCFNSFVAKTQYFAGKCSQVTTATLTTTTVTNFGCNPTEQNDAYITTKCVSGHFLRNETKTKKRV